MPDKTTENYNEQQKQARLEEYYLKGNDYCYGDGVEQDYAEAFKWYKTAAEQGNASAQNMVGLCYYCDDGIAQNYTEAFKWYKKSADKGMQTLKAI